jgi:hypothetical protein
MSPPLAVPEGDSEISPALQRTRPDAASPSPGLTGG